MKKILLMFALVIFLLTTGCYSNYVTKEKYSNLQQVNREIIDEYSKLAEDNTELASEKYRLENELNSVDNNLQLTEDELDKYKDLINNLNALLRNVYYVYGEGGGTYVFGTGFSLEYNNKFYIITAGHMVNGEWGYHPNLKFKANYSNEWIYPKLLKYENDFNNRNDYAIFASDKINNGLQIDFDNDNNNPQFLLGTINNDLNVLRENKDWGIDGECGSPVINLDKKVIGVFIGYMTPIKIVTEAIDNLEKN